jgi:hypothetical protein
MVLRRFSWPCIWLGACLLAALPAAAQMYRHDQDYFVEGRILGAQGLGFKLFAETEPASFARARFILEGRSGEAAGRPLAADGSVLFKVPSFAPWRLVAANGDLRFELELAEPVPTLPFPPMQVPALERLEGRLSDPAGQPVAGAVVYLEAQGLKDLGPWRMGPLRTASDPAGAFALPFLAGSRLVALAPGFEPAVLELPRLPPPGKIWVLKPAARRLRVMLTPEQPAADVLAEGLDGIPYGFTGRDGYLSLGAPPAAPLRLVSDLRSPPLYRPIEWRLESPRWRDGEALTFLGGDIWLVGEMVDPDGEKIAGARIIAFGPKTPAFIGGGNDVVAEASTGIDGLFSLGPLDPAHPATWIRDESEPKLPWSLEVRAEGFADHVAPWLPEKGAGLVDLGTLRLERSSLLAGWVTGGDGRGLGGAQVYLSRDKETELERRGEPRATSREDGSFSLGGLRPGEEVALTAWAEGYLPRRQGGVSLAGGAPEIRLEKGSWLEVLVLDPEGLPVNGVRLALHEHDQRRNLASPDEEWLATPHSFFTETGDNGRAVFRAVPRRIFRLSADASGRHLPFDRLVEVRQERAQLEIRLERGATLRGKVLDAGGKPLSQASLRVKSKGLDQSIVGAVDEQGNFDLPGLDAGLVDVRAAADGYAAATASVLVGKTGDFFVELRLGKAIELRGVLTDAGGKPLAGWQIFFDTRNQALDSGWSPSEKPVTTAGDGTFAIPLGEAGTYTAYVYPPASPSGQGMRVGTPTLEQDLVVAEPGLFVELVLP